MDIKIVADSSCDLSQELKEEMNIDIAPLTLILEDKEYIDNEDLNRLEYIENMKKCKTAPKTACPSPQDYMEKYKGEESIFVVPLSSKLSGSYNSAVLAKNLFLDEIGNKFIHVFDSVTASVGQTIISLKINELSKLNLGEFEIVEKVNKYISEMKTFFLLESLDHLAKAGRLNPIIAKVANMLSIKPIMGSNDDGTIRLVEKTRGYKKAFKRFIDIIGEEGSNLEQKVLGIAHCNCLERALKFKEEVLKRYNFKDVVVVEMSGLSTTYADDGGLVIAF
ncbi:DegV family protein [Clostridium massiliodielmoense]|uniref:DegV family protein n=1 Tax=Clostridium massiliodielmoense TaxID=1776385 RepID=UPI0004DA4EBE|nr:DegV family protein [Clostridium massiliodielmoense]KEH99337.1 fatty acid-binding protein DegV [Clostridium botulinum C/D str. BKT12695]